MVSPSTLLKASYNASKEFFRPPVAETREEPQPAPRVQPVMVPIRSIGPSHGERIATHLLALGDHDRYLRFGYSANDEQIRRYVDSLNFDRDEIFGIYNRKLQLIAMRLSPSSFWWISVDSSNRTRASGVGASVPLPRVNSL